MSSNKVYRLSRKEFSTYVQSDLFRYTGVVSWRAFLKALVLWPGFRYTFFLRVSRYLYDRKGLFWVFYLVAKMLHRHYTFRYGISIPVLTNIGYGFYIGHFGGIVVNGQSRIGHNVNISHGVTLGQANRGRSIGYPTIGDYVYIGPGAKVIGKVNIGNYAAIGANSVVTKDVPSNAVVAGVPASVISDQGSSGYVNRTWNIVRD